MKKKNKKAAKEPAVTKLVARTTNTLGVMPLADRVLVKPLPPETTTPSGIIIPDTAKEKPEQGKVVAVGPGKKTDEGRVVPVSVKVGDKVMFNKYGFDEVKVAGVEYYLISEQNILAVIN